jgi:O-Antigen ligase
MTALTATAGPALRTKVARVPDALLALGVCGSLAAMAAANGGFFPTSWGWAALGFAWVSLVALLAGRECALSREGILFLVGTTAFTAWTFASAVWSWDAGNSILEGERTLVLLTGVAALLLVARGRRHVLLGSLLAAITGVCSYSLATRLFPAAVGRFDVTAGYRLFTPVGYWNSLGLFAVMGILLALGFVARARSLGARAAASAAIVLLAPTVYFTFSRGSWLALGIALAFLLALDPSRLQTTLALLAAAPAPAAAVDVAWHSRALTTSTSTAAQATHDGHRLALVLLVLVPVAAVLAVVLGVAERRLRPSRELRIAYGTLLAGVLAAVVVGVSAHWGSPTTLAKRTWHAFDAPPHATTANLNQRLFNFSSNGRVELWRLAIREYHTAPLTGTGAGTYELWWNQHRPEAAQILDAHSLYLETMAELGLVGLALLGAALLIPLSGAFRRRHAPLVPFAAAAFVAWAVHAGVDWDWEITAVTLTALACATVLVDGVGTPVRLGTPARSLAAAAAVGIAAFALVATVGNRALARADASLVQGNRAQAYDEAKRAARWMPWSGDPLILVGELDVARGNHAVGVRKLRQAVAREPRSYLAWYALADAASGATRRHAALQVIRLNPRSDEAAEMRGLLQKKRP